MTMNRRLILAGLGAVPFAPGVAFAADDDATEDAPKEMSYVTGDIVLGDENAPVTVIEYASTTCPHCGAFHKNTFPEVKKNYVDTGKVKFIMREVYFDKFGLWVGMTARCGGEAGYYPMMDMFLNDQASWARAGDDAAVGQAIQKIGRRAGLSSEQLNACLSDRDFAKALLKNYQDNAEADEVRSTPTFIIAGETHTGNMAYDQFSAILEAALADS
ncbi:MAG: DsbA family protein [Pseudomonadota bacterium]